MADPTPKSAEINDLIKQAFGRDREETIRANICMICEKPALRFRDALSINEYAISGLCQACQDEAFGFEDLS